MSQTTTTDMDRIKNLAYIVANKSRRIPFWVYNNVYGERLSTEDAVDMAMTAVYEALYDDPDQEDRDVVARATKIYKSYFWGRGTPAYDRRRRGTSGKSRVQLSAELLSHLPWGVPAAEQIDSSEPQEFFLEDLYSVIEDHYGPETALICVMHYGYKWSLNKIVTRAMGIAKDTKEHSRECVRLSRLLKSLRSHIETLNV